MKKFTLGVVSGMSSLALAVPVFAQITNAASGDQTSSASFRTTPTQACVQAMANLEGAQLSNIDAEAAARKSAMQAHRDALVAAASITDDTQRAAALKAAEEALRTAMKPAQGTQSDAVKTAMDAVRTACGNTMMPMRGFGGPGGGAMFERKMFDPTALATKLGMTADELKTELDSGKTLQDIATEKGVTLPAPPQGGHRGGGWMHGKRGANGSQTSSSVSTQS
jgi:hypothetical protein